MPSFNLKKNLLQNIIIIVIFGFIVYTLTKKEDKQEDDIKKPGPVSMLKLTSIY